MRFYFALFLRQFRSQIFISAIQVFSLFIGFIVFIALFSMIRDDLGYDEFWETRGSLCRVVMEEYHEDQLSYKSARSYYGLPGLLKEELPEVIGMTRLIPDLITVFVGEQQIQDVKMFYADTNVFKVLPREILAAESSSVFPGIHSVAISESLAKKLYGSVKCLGKELRINEGWVFSVSTVYEDIPEKSHLCMDLLLTRASLVYYMQNFDNSTGTLLEKDDFSYVDPGPYHAGSWRHIRSYGFILLQKGTDISVLQDKTKTLLNRIPLPGNFQHKTIVPLIQPVERIFLHSGFPDEIKAGGSFLRLVLQGMIAVIVLIISWVNFVNLNSVLLHEKSKEISLRMIHGERTGITLFSLFLNSLVLSMIAAGLVIPGIQLLSVYFPFLIPDSAIIFVLVFLAFLSALLTLFAAMASFRKISITDGLKGKNFFLFKGVRFRQLMVILQFTSGIALIICTIVFFFQMKFISDRNLGFKGENVVYSFSPMTMNQRPDMQQKLKVFRDETANIPGVKDFCVSSSIPGQPLHFQGVNVRRPFVDYPLEVFFERINIDYSYFDTYTIDLIAGRNFIQEEIYETPEVIINRKAAQKLGFPDIYRIPGEYIAIGDQHYKIIGVVENYHHYSLKDDLMPIVFFKSLRWRANVGYYSWELQENDTQTLDEITQTWQRIYPDEQMVYKFVNESYNQHYISEIRFGNSFLIASILAVLISVLGLITLSNYNILKRTRETGIRKTFGAGSMDILYHYQKEFIILLLISSIMAMPVAYYISDRWLLNFAFRITPHIWMFLSAFLLVFLVTIFSTLIQTWRAAVRNPADILRYE